MIRGKRGIRCAAGKRDLPAFGVNDKFGFSVAAQHAAHIADVVQQAGDDQMDIIGG